MLNKLLICFFMLLFSLSSYAQIEVIDGLNKRLVIDKPAIRIISLAPHVTELLYAAGATNQVIAAVSFSDYPEQAKKLPRVGSYNKFDLESIIALKPDLIVAWKSGNPDEQLKSVEKLGYKMFYSEPRNLKDVANEIQQLGALLNTQSIANNTANNYLKKLSKLKIKYSKKEKVGVFYQVWSDPLFTINRKHIISRVIDLCGGLNVFSELDVLSPRVSIEAVIEKNPEVIVIGMAESRKEWLGEWNQWHGMAAVKNNNIYPVNADLIVRHTPRILEGAQLMCEHLDKVRNK
jgi:iron complex transport system substrate-binding protein